MWAKYDFVSPTQMMRVNWRAGAASCEYPGVGPAFGRMMMLRLGWFAAPMALAMVAVPLAAQDDTVVIGTSLFGENEVGKGAGEDASGDFSAEIDMANGTMCYMLEIDGLDDFTAAHIHEGARKKNGPPVVTLELLGDDGDDICIDVDPALLAKMVKKKANYYVNVHTAAFPAGAIRGQLDD